MGLEHLLPSCLTHTPGRLVPCWQEASVSCQVDLSAVCLNVVARWQLASPRTHDSGGQVKAAVDFVTLSEVTSAVSYRLHGGITQCGS